MRFRCWYCERPTWIEKNQLRDHMMEHKMRGDDVGTMAAPLTWEDYVRRFGAMGLMDIEE